MTEEQPTPAIPPQLNRTERWVGLFVALAILLLLGALAFYIFDSAKRKGWYVAKAPYFALIDSAQGIKVGDKVKLMGFDVGEIKEIEAQPADDRVYNVYVEFDVRSPYYGYLWTDSRVRIVSDLLGNRYLEVTKGREGLPSYVDQEGELTGQIDNKTLNYLPFTSDSKPYWLEVDEATAINDRAEALLSQVEQALPGIFSLTNQLASTLSNLNQLSVSVDTATTSALPAVENLALITTQLTNQNGSLGQWLLPTNLNTALETTLARAGNTMTNADNNLTLAVSNLSLTLTTVANLTSNLNSQVAVNTNILAEISTLVVTANDFMEKLSAHWLLRSAFKEKKQNRTKK